MTYTVGFLLFLLLISRYLTGVERDTSVHLAFETECAHSGFWGFKKNTIFRKEHVQSVALITFLSLLWLFFLLLFPDSKPRLLWLAECCATFIFKYHLRICM